MSDEELAELESTRAEAESLKKELGLRAACDWLKSGEPMSKEGARS